jgi:hypothetical protein
MRQIVPVLMATATLLAPAVAHGAAKHAERAPTCPPPHAHVVLADKAAVVFRLETFNRRLDEQEHEEAACSHANRNPFVLSWCDDLECEGPSFNELTLAGNMLAYERYATSGSEKYETAEPASWTIQVRNLATHRLIHSSPTSTSEPPSTVIGNGPAKGVVVKSDGSVAWIAVDGWHPYAPSPVTTYQVWKIDRTGQHLLAMGPHIVPGSIALAGNTVYWTDDGTPEMATLN